MAHGKHKKKKTLSSPLSESRSVREPNRLDSFHHLKTLETLVGLLADSPTRDVKAISNRRLRSGFSHLNSIQDGRREQDISRTYGSRRYLTTFATPAEVVRRDVCSPEMRRAGMPSQMRAEFRDDPRRVIVCVRRRARKATLFALRKIGKGAGKKRLKRARWSDSSYITCKRR